MLTKVDAKLGGTTITVQSPVSSDGGVITIVQGYDYRAVDGRAITFDIVTPAPLDVAQGASLMDASEVAIATGTLISTGAGTYRASIDLQAATTAAWPLRKRLARLMATTVGGGRIALLEAVIDVQ